MSESILITGGSGFVGAHLVRAHLERGDSVILLDIQAPDFEHPQLKYIQSDIRDQEGMEPHFEGVDRVYHNASVVRTRHNRKDLIWSINLEGSRAVLRSCQNRKVPKLVYVSTASVVYNGVDVENGDEELPYSHISQAPYADSKIQAEKEILTASGEKGVLTCAIRPHLIFGPGDQRFLPTILERARRGKLKYSVGFETKFSDFTYVSNLVDALLSAGDRLDEKLGGNAFFVTNGEPFEFFAFVNKVLERLNLPQTQGRVPYFLAYTVAAVVEFFDTLLGGTLKADEGMSRFSVKYMCTHHYFSIEKAKRLLGYQPRVSLEEGIARTVDHHLQHRTA